MLEKIKYPALITITLLALFALLFQLIYRQQKPDPVFQSTLVLSPTSSPEITVAPEEPIVTSWRTYSNDTYNFTLNVPGEWKEEDYSSYYHNGGTLIAFSPDPLPCKTCTYFQNGFFSIRIYSQEIEPELYAAFSQKLKAIGKSKNYQGLHIDGKVGVYYGNTIAVENKNLVYEITLDKNGGNDKALESRILKKAIGSFHFTHLLFE